MKKVLIIDDEEDICFLLSGLLKQLKYSVDFANDLNSGLAKAKESAPDILLLDVNLPDGNGIEALPIFRQALPNTSILLMSAHMLEQDKSELKSKGADDFLPKPISMDMIATVLNKNLKVSK